MSEKPKLLIATDFFLPRWDGVARFLTQVIPGLSDDFDITVIAPKFPGGEPEFDGLDKVRLIRLPTMKLRVSDYNMSKLSLKNLKIVKQEVGKADIVFVQTSGPVIGSAAIIAGRLKGIPVVTYLHSIEGEMLTKYLGLKSIFAILFNAFVKLFVKWLYNRTSLIMVPSREIGELMTWNGVRSRKAVVHLGVDIQKFKPPKSRAAAKKKINIEPDTLTIGFLPRITGEKDPLTLLRAFSRLRRKYPKLKLMMIGDGEPGMIQKFANQSGVWLLGTQNNVVPYLQAMDINVLPSLTETTSLSTFEAMACGCAVVSTPVGFIKEYIQHGRNGYLFPQKDVYRLTKLLQELLDDEKLRLTLGDEARRTVSKQFSWNLTLEKIRYLLIQELEKRGK